MSAKPDVPELLIDELPVDPDQPDTGVIALFTINRPDKLNALNTAVRSALHDACAWAQAADHVRVVVITGAAPNEPPEGKRAKPNAFIAGADIEEFLGRGAIATRNVMRTKSAFEAVWLLRKPTIAMIDGFALGGGNEVAMSCDLRIVSDRSTFGQPEVKLGVIPGGGGTQRLTALVGYGKAMELTLSGKFIDSAEALRIGLVNEVVAADGLRERVLEQAREIGQWSSLTLEMAKRAVRGALDDGITQGIEREAELFALIFASQDKEIGVKAFLKRATPAWTHE